MVRHHGLAHSLACRDCTLETLAGLIHRVIQAGQSLCHVAIFGLASGTWSHCLQMGECVRLHSCNNASFPPHALAPNRPTPHPVSLSPAVSATYTPTCLLRNSDTNHRASSCSFGQGTRCHRLPSLLTSFHQPKVLSSCHLETFSLHPDPTLHLRMCTGPWGHVHFPSTQGTSDLGLIYNSAQVGILPIREDNIKA